jgi:hypothetical protein
VDTRGGSRLVLRKRLADEWIDRLIEHESRKKLRKFRVDIGRRAQQS